MTSVGADCPAGSKIETFDECVEAALALGFTGDSATRDPLSDHWDHVITGCFIEANVDNRINYNSNPDPANPQDHGYIRVCRDPRNKALLIFQGFFSC